MNIPDSREKELRKVLAEYLSAETDIVDWQYYSNDHSPQMQPVGAIVIPKTQPIEQFNLDYLPKRFFINIRLLVSHANQEELLDTLDDWRSHLTNTVMRKLYLEGYKDFFHKITWKSAQISPSINQDRGGTGAVMLEYTWDDNGFWSDNWITYE